VKLIRDPIHGYIEIDDEILKIVSSRVFQRLRLISQNAMAHLVYPGMRHSRFEHSLGVMQLAGEFARFVKPPFFTPGYERLVKIAGLLHDIGHLAFSHTFESALQVANEIYGVKDVFYEGKKTHVKIGVKIIQENLSSILEAIKDSTISDPIKFLTNVLEENVRSEEERFALQIISNFIDADRGDYLLRDSYYAGVGYGSYDIERLKRVLVYVDGRIAVLRKAIPIVEQFLLARMYMFENVYFHSVVGMYNSILSHAIAKMIQTGLLDLSRLLEITDINVLSKLDKLDERYKRALLYREGYRRIKKEVINECLNRVDRDELINLSRETDGKIIYHEFFDVPYKEEKEAVYIFDGSKLQELSKVSNLITAVKDLKKAVIVYHVSEEDRIKKYKEILSNCE